MNKLEYLLTVLSEECSEVSQQVAKIQRFGADNYHPTTKTVNRELLVKELNDLLAVVEMLNSMGFDLSDVGNRIDIDNKKFKVSKYMVLSKELGNLEED